jgi:WD40 repeat protein
MVLSIVYQPQASFRVVAVTRCTGTLSGHTEAILCVAFSPDCKRLLTGSGDGTLRLWALDTETPIATLKGLDPDLVVVTGDGTGDGAVHLADIKATVPGAGLSAALDALTPERVAKYLFTSG